MAALVLLDRRDLKGDIWACVLLVISIASFTFALPIALGIAVELTLTRSGTWLRRAWVCLIPLGLYGVWTLWSLQYGESGASLSNLGLIPVLLIQQIAAVMAALSGFFRNPGATIIDQVLTIQIGVGIPLALGVIGLLFARTRTMPRPTPRFWALLIAIVIEMILTALVFGASRPPNASRYAWMSSIIMVLLLVEATVETKSPRWMPAAIVGLAFVSLIANTAQLHTGGSKYRLVSSFSKAQLAAVDIGGPYAPKGALVGNQVGAGGATAWDLGLNFPVADYLRATDRFGSPGYTLSELGASPPGPRSAADAEFIQIYSLQAEPIDLMGKPASGLIVAGGPPNNARLFRAGRCVILKPVPGGSGEAGLTLPRGGLSFKARGPAPATISLARFGDTYGSPVAQQPGPAKIVIPEDSSDIPWRASVESASTTKVCPV